MPQEPVDSALAERFKEIWRFYARTQAEFAEKWGVAKTTVSDIERGAKNPPKSLLLRIIEKGDFSASWVLDGNGPKKNFSLSSMREPAFPYVTPGFPDKEIVRATELVYEFMGAGSLTPTKKGWYISTVAELLVRGHSEDSIRERVAPGVRQLANSEEERPPRSDLG